MRKSLVLVGALAFAACNGGRIDSGSDLQMKGPLDVVTHPIRHQGSGSSTEYSIASLAGAPDAIYLNRNGRTYAGGDDDSAHGVSSVVAGQGLSAATIPALGWTEASWQSFLSCIQDEYGRFNVKVTDQRPTAGTYIEAAIGGTGAELGYGGGVGGVAPVDTYNCRPIPTGVVFIFANNTWASDPQTACEIAAQEIGHAIVPLDHEYLASDPMTYLGYNGHKTFQDQDVSCGEYAPRACFCNRGSQNSVQLLLATVGPASSNPPPTNPPPTNPPPLGGDTTPPVVQIVSPTEGASSPGDSSLTVTVSATDPDDAVKSVSLFWGYTNNLLPCDSTTYAGVSCTQSGSTYQWTFKVGTGARQFYAVATDSAGNSAQSATIHLTLSGGAPPPPSSAPAITIDQPAGGTVLSPGAPLYIQATVTDNNQVTDVAVNWTNAAGTTVFPMLDAGNGVFVLDTTVSTSAVPGARSFTVTATDTTGQSTTSTAVTLQVQ